MNRAMHSLSRLLSFSLALLLLAGCRWGARYQPLEVTYIGNEGFLIATGSTKILIDALSDSKYYVSPSESLVAQMMDDRPPFDDVDYVLVTHDHADHFNAAMTSRYLDRHPGAQFVADSQACSKLVAAGFAGKQPLAFALQRGERRTIRGGKAVITILRLDHGGSRETNNFAYLVSADGHTFLHVGDARLASNAEILRAVDWSSYDVDLLFLEFFDRGSDVQSLIDTLIKPKQVILMHIPGGEEEAVRNADERVHPRTVVFGKEGETRKLGNP